jgi:hypothetical protein
VRPRIAAWTGAALVLAPIFAYAWIVAGSATRVPYLDDYDALVDFTRRFLDDGGPAARLTRLFSPHNEHVILTARSAALLVTAVRGQIDLHALDLLGNALLLVLVAALLAGFRAGEPLAERLLAFAPAALLLVQPQYWMVLISPTTALSSIASTAWAALALVALSRDSAAALAGAWLAAAAATFSLGSGVLVLPLGALVLALRGRARRAFGWAAATLPLAAAWAALEVGGPAHHWVGPGRLIAYGLNFAGSAAAFSERGISLVAGALLVAAAAALALRSWPRRNPVLFCLLLFVLGSIGLNALARAHQGAAAPLRQPWYRFYASLLLALAYLGWAEVGWGRRASAARAAALALAAAFSIASFARYGAEPREVSTKLREGLARWWTTGERGLFHPETVTANQILLAALDRGLLRLPDGWLEPEPAAPPRRLPRPWPGTRVPVHVDAFSASASRSGFLLAGWADGGGDTRDQQVEIALRSPRGALAFPAHTVLRIELLGPDLGRRSELMRLAGSGFHALVSTRQLAPGVYGVGVLVRRGNAEKLTWLTRRIAVRAGGAAAELPPGAAPAALN